MIDLIVIAVIVCIVGAVGLYLYKAKKRGDTCVGCPHAKQCGNNCGGKCGSVENRQHQ